MDYVESIAGRREEKVSTCINDRFKKEKYCKNVKCFMGGIVGE